ncbi:MAG: hypothetical protein ACE5HE_14395, partial [Phycisphaerae bacterium]
FLAWSVFDRRWVAWCVALFAVVLYAPVTYVTYPNKLAPHWLFPLAAAFAVQASDRHCPGRIPIKLGATALVLGQVHSLYAVFTGIALAPGLLWAFLGRLRRGGVDLWQAAACLAALWLGSPFALAARRVDVAVDVAVDVEHTVVTEQSSDFFHFSNDWVMLKPSFLQHPRGLAMFALAVAGVGCSLSGRSRVRSAHLTAAAATVSCVLFVPPLCAGAVALLGGEWVAARMLALATASIIALGVGGLASIVEPFTSRSRLLSSAGAGVVCLAAAFTPADAAGRWHDYLTSARAPVEQRHQALRHLRELRAFLQAHIPPGDTVLADPQTSMWLVMLHDCYVVATASGSTVLDMEQRRADVQTIVGPRTPWSARRELLRKYGVTRCMVDTRVLPERALSWARGHLAGRPIHHGPYVLVALDTER